MTSRRTLITSMSAGLLLAAAPRAFSRSTAAADCAPADCVTCGPTESSTAGPFYVSNTPLTGDINLLRAPGTPMMVSGIVLGGADGRRALAAARVELWHADSAGRYHPEGSGDISRYRTEEVNLRGQLVAGSDGRFSFTSIVPAHYANRRRHLHWRVVADGHRTLVTQTYWRDELGTARERLDPIDQDPESCRWIDFQPKGATMAGSVILVMQPG